MGRNSFQGEDMLHTRKPMTEETAAEMAARNERRLEIVKRVLGDKYAHHPAHYVQRKEEPKSTSWVREDCMTPGWMFIVAADGAGNRETVLVA